MQDHANQGYTVCHLSLIRNFALDIFVGVATVRDKEIRCSQKRDLGTFLWYLSFWVSSVESPLIFYTKKIRKTKYKKYMTKLYDFID